MAPTTTASSTRTAPNPAGTARQSDWLGAGLAVLTIGWSAQEFTPLLLLYRSELHLSNTAVQAAFALYALGLIPGLLLGGPVSDRIGRRAVVVPTVALAAVGSALLMFGGLGIGWLFLGRLVVGVACGAAFSSGAAWIKELSAGTEPNPGPRRLTVMMTSGFGAGPLVAGALAQWAPAPDVLPYVPHLVLAAIAVPLALRTPETRPRGNTSRVRANYRGRFLRIIAPLAPWVFASGSIGLSYLPGLLNERLGDSALLFAAVAPTIVAASGIAVQPLAHRLDHPDRSRLLTFALIAVVLGLVLGIFAANQLSPLLTVLAAIVLGIGYGSCQVYGLAEVQRIAPPDHLASMTAMYQALTYVGFVIPFPLAALAAVTTPAVLLGVVALLAVLTLAWLLPASRRKVLR